MTPVKAVPVSLLSIKYLATKNLGALYQQRGDVQQALGARELFAAACLGCACLQHWLRIAVLARLADCFVTAAGDAFEQYHRTDVVLWTRFTACARHMRNLPLVRAYTCCCMHVARLVSRPRGCWRKHPLHIRGVLTLAVLFSRGLHRAVRSVLYDLVRRA